MEEEVGQGDTEKVAAFMAATHGRYKSDEARGQALDPPASRGTIQKWRTAIEKGAKVGVSAENRIALDKFLFSGGTGLGVDRYREGAAAVLRELRDFLDALEKRLGGE